MKERIPCPECGKPSAIMADRRIRTHGKWRQISATASEYNYCPGSGKQVDYREGP